MVGQHTKGAVKKRKRVARGTGSGHGGTATRGHKGHSSRSGGGSHIWSEGGQMPLIRRLPKGGFKNIHRVEYQVVNLTDLNRFDAGTEVTPAALKAEGLARRLGQPIKLLGTGEVDRALTVRVHAASSTAKAKLEAAGGRLELLVAKG